MAYAMKAFPQTVPTDQQQCDIRVVLIEAQAFPAKWDAASETFISPKFATPVPWYLVCQWRPASGS